jgi:hypothetical protein
VVIDKADNISWGSGENNDDEPGFKDHGRLVNRDRDAASRPIQLD